MIASKLFSQDTGEWCWMHIFMNMKSQRVMKNKVRQKTKLFCINCIFAAAAMRQKPSTNWSSGRDEQWQRRIWGGSEAALKADSQSRDEGSSVWKLRRWNTIWGQGPPVASPLCSRPVSASASVVQTHPSHPAAPGPAPSTSCHLVFVLCSHSRFKNCGSFSWLI